MGEVHEAGAIGNRGGQGVPVVCPVCGFVRARGTEVRTDQTGAAAVQRGSGETVGAGPGMAEAHAAEIVKAALAEAFERGRQSVRWLEVAS